MHDSPWLRVGLAIGAVLFFLPALHPLLIPVVGVPSHLLWWAHVLPVALSCYRWGRRGALLVPISTLAVLLGEHAFGAGYGTPSGWETAAALATALTATNALVAVVAFYAGRSARHLQALAYRDALTELPNRRLLRARLGEALGALRAGEQAALLFVDLDDFKLVNDGLGHLVGDGVLVEVAARLRASVQRTDLVARWGGDEFVLLLPCIQRSEHVARIVRRLLQAIEHPIHVQGHILVPSATIGVAVGSRTHSPDRLIREADTALHHAKASGKRRYALFDHGMQAAATHRLELTARIRRAVEEDRFVPYYQPIYCARSGRLCGLEALARWLPREGKPVPPSEFIPAAEASGLIRAIGGRILQLSLRQLRHLEAEIPELSSCFLSVNLSVRELYDEEVPYEITRQLARHGVAAGRLVLELTESLFMERSPRLQTSINALDAAGIILAIDDFGSGYSSLGYLHRIPAGLIKIDRALLGADDRAQRALIGPIVQMARALELRVVAEGIETPEQLTFLRRSGVDLLQGFLLGQPVSAAELPALVAGGRRRLREGLPRAV